MSRGFFLIFLNSIFFFSSLCLHWEKSNQEKSLRIDDHRQTGNMN